MTGKIALIYGSSGALGSSLVSVFTSCPDWQVIGVDFRPIVASPKNRDGILAEIVPKSDGDLTGKTDYLLQETGKALSGKKIDSIICVAGGWAGGNASDPSE
jgi:dihydropteridine reductase